MEEHVMMILENKKLRLELDGSGRILSLENKAGGKSNVIDAPTDIFFMVLDDAQSQCKETLVYACAQEFSATQVSATEATFTASDLQIDNGRPDAGHVDITVTLRVILEDDKVSFTADIDNNTEMRVTDFEYPRIGVIKTLGDGNPALFWPEQPGKMITNIGEYLSAMPNHRENSPHCLKVPYPGIGSMGMIALLDRTDSMFLQVRDPHFISAIMKVIGSGEDRGAITLTVDKHLCVKRERITTAPIVLQFYTGSWHKGAKAYADWISTYRPAHVKPDWIREMTGYYLVINKQQFGYEMWDYTTLPKLWEMADASGCSTLGLFGWYQSGHDNNYPDLEVSHTMGGEEMLKENIKAVQAAGGRVMLYYQGHLIDVGSEYYKSGMGERVSCKTNWGTPYPEFYIKSHKSDMLGSYSKKMFVIGCPSCPEWRELMVEREKWLAGLGADGTLYDQIGGMPPYICFDESHPHDGGNPARALTGGQTKLLGALQTTAKQIAPSFAFMSEHITDLYSAYLDAIHGIKNTPSQCGDRANAIGDEACAQLSFPDVFRYCFPEAVITIRNAQPFVDRRHVNYAFTFNFPIEIEIRYRADREDVLADKFAEQRVYAKKVSQLRKKYTKEIAYGKYIDTIGITCDQPTVYAKGYETDGTVTVTLWNDSSAFCTPTVTVDGMQLISVETADGLTSSTICELAPNSVAVAIFRAG